MTWGVDYASVDGNKPPDTAAFKRAGGSFVWVRGSFSYWDPSHKAWACAHDPCIARDWAAWGSSGVTRATYMFPVLEASQSAAEQVAVLKSSLDAVGGLRPGVDLPPCLDIEFPGRGIADTGLDRAGVLKWIRAAVTELRKQFGCWPIIYTSGRVWNDVDADCLANPAAPDLTQCPLWLARYAYKTRQPAVIPPPAGLSAPPVPTPWGDAWHAHQDQGDAIGAPGFTSTVDVDRFRPAKLGDRGGHVAWGQHKARSVIAYQQLVEDGQFGPQTRSAVVAFQAAHGIPTTGEMDLRTFAAMAWV